MLVPILPLYAKDFGISYGLIGVVLAGESVGMLLFDVPSGLLLEFLGRRRAMLAGLGVALLSTLALFWAGSVSLAVLCRLLAGCGKALYSVARHAYIADTVAATKRGRAISLLGGIFRIGGFVGPLVGGAVAVRYGLRVPFLLVGGTSFLACGVIAISVRDFTQAGLRSRNARAGLKSLIQGDVQFVRSLWTTLRAHYRIFLSAGLAQVFAQMIRAGRGVIIPLYAADVIGLDVQAIGLIVGIASAVDMSLFYPAGWIMDHWGRKRAIVPSFVIQFVGMVLVSMAWDFKSLLAFSILIGFGNGLGSGSMMTLGADLAPLDKRGEFLGVWRLIGDTGAMGGPLVGGSVADLFVLPVAARVISGAGLLAALLFTLLVPETLSRE